MEDSLSTKLLENIRQVPDFPKAGINFYDITTLLSNAALFREVIESFTARYKDQQIDALVGIEARGFIFGAAAALELQLPFIPVRKPGKLPAATESATYALEYGEDSLEIHSDALRPGMRVLIMDDLIATGGTVAATKELVERLGAEVIECAFVLELSFLNGRDKVSPTPVMSLLQCNS